MKKFNRNSIIQNRKFRNMLLPAAVCFLFPALLFALPERINKQQEYVPGEILVQYRETVSSASAQTLSNSNGISFVKSISSKGKGSRMHLVKFRGLKGDKNGSLENTIKMLNRDPNVEYAQPNYIYRINTNDTYYASQWGMKNTGQTVNGVAGIAGKDINVESAWAVAGSDCTTNSTIVAVLDTGVNYNHEDISANMWSASTSCNSATGTYYGCDFIHNDQDPMDYNGHGTHVAGIIGGKGSNSKGITGVCQSAKIMAVRVLGTDGSGTTAGIISGIYWAVLNGAKVINMSLGGGPFDTATSNAIGSLADPDSAISHDVLVVIAAGNGGSDGIGDNNDVIPSYPASYTHANILSVAAMTPTGTRASFSNYGAVSVDIAAPGTDILSSVMGTQSIAYSDPLTSGWTISGNWGYQNSSCTGYASLVNPANVCSGGNYSANANDEVYKNFDLSSYASAYVNYYMRLDTESTFDFLNVGYKAAGGDPFTAGGWMTSYSGSTNGSWFNFSHDLSGCTTSTCTIGYQLTSDGSVQYSGAIIDSFNIIGTTLATNQYAFMSGTSQATPHVAGIATMVRNRDPNFTYLDTVNAIKWGGIAESAFATTTSTGKRADALGSLKYIPPSDGVNLL